MMFKAVMVCVAIVAGIGATNGYKDGISPFEACTEPSGTFLPVEGSCMDYGLCNKGQLIKLTCGEGNYYDQDAGYCKLDTEYICNKRPEQSCATVATGSIIPVTGNCKIYQLCINGKSIKLYCAENQLFDADLGYCVHDENGICWGSSTTSDADVTTTAVSVTTTDLPLTTTDAPVTTTDAPVTTTEAPATTTDAPVTTTDAPVTTTATPVTTTDTPVTTTGAPVTTTDTPVTTTDAPVTTTDTPVTTSDAPVTTTNAPVTTTDAPVTTTDAPVTMTDAPVTTTDAPVTTTDAPVTTTDVPVTTTDAPVTTTDAPVTTTDTPVTTTDVPITTTDAQVTTTDAPVTTTDAPVTTTDVPITTTDAQVTTTDVPVTTTNAPVTTTDVPVTTTDAPVTTTDVPVTTTDAPVTTTDVPVTTTDAPVTTTDVPVTTPDAPVTTTDAPVTTTDAPVTTTDVPVTSTDAPVTTTDAPVTTTASDAPLTTTTIKGNPNNVCEGISFGVVSHETCDKYYECDDEVATVRTCPEGDYFDQTAGLCTKDVNGVCSASRCANSVTGTRFTDKSNCQWYYECKSSAEYSESCASGYYFDGTTLACVQDVDNTCGSVAPTACQGKVDGTIIAHGSCGSYYVCSDNEDEVKKCDNGYRFDVQKSECVEDLKFTCFCEQNPAAIFAGDKCNEYYKCNNGAATALSCSQGDYFDIIESSCVSDGKNICAV